MSTPTSTPYGGFLESLANKQIDLDSDTLKVMLLGSGYTYSDSHRYVADLGSNEVAGQGYTAGGATLSGVTVSYSGGTLTLSAQNVSWTDSSITADYAIVYDATPGSAATNPLICCVNMDGAESDTNGTFAIDWTNGQILQLALG